MKYVKAAMRTYEATVYGRIEPGKTYEVEDDVAKRWEQAGIATLTETPPAEPPVPEPEPMPAPLTDEPPAPAPEEEDEDEDEDSETAAARRAFLRAEVHRLSEVEGMTQRAIAEQLGLSRTRVHDLLHT
jgi:DNA-directed RNA polymerase specialized sigma24 family protein